MNKEDLQDLVTTLWAHSETTEMEQIYKILQHVVDLLPDTLEKLGDEK